MSRTLTLPEGTYTLLPLIEACDNFVLPAGPWAASNLQSRWTAYRSSRPPPTLLAEQANSALDSDDDDDPARPPSAAADADSEFLAPFFITLPTSAAFPLGPTSRSRRPSTARAAPSLRASSPTPSSAPAPAPTSDVPAAPPQPIGFLRPEILKALIADNAHMASMSCQPVWKFLPPIETPLPPPSPSVRSRRSSSTSRRPSMGLSALSSSSATKAESSSSTGSRRGSGGAAAMGMSMTPRSPTMDDPTDSKGANQLAEALKSLRVAGQDDGSRTWAAGFEDWVVEEGSDTMREHMDRVCRGWQMKGMFSDALGGWRDEHYAIYGPHSPFDKNAEPKLPGGNFAFSMERAACALFGVATFGVHCTAYVEEPDEPMKLWIPRRSATKQTWPSYLDNTVAGGITSQESPLSSIIRECAEEASLDPSITEPALRSVSLLSYTYRTPTGWVQPEIQYIYDLKLEKGVIPSTNEADGEVESFSLMDVDEVVQRMVNGEFKANCAMVLVDFFLRHGFLTPESDVRYLECATRMRRPLVLPGPV